MNDGENVEIPSSIENLEFGPSTGGVEEAEATHEEVATYEEDTTQDEAERDDSETESQDQEQQQETQEDDGDQGETDEAREHNRLNAQRRIAAREQQETVNSQFLNNLREHVSQQMIGEIDEEKYQEIAEQDGQAVADTQRRLDEFEMREKQRELDEGLRQIEHFQSQIGMEIAQAQNSIDLFNPGKKDSYNESLLQEAQRSWVREHAVMQADENGNVFILGAKDGAPSMYEYLNEKAGFYQDILQKASLRGQQAAQRTAGRADFRAKETSKTKESNSLQALEDRVGDIPLA